MLTKAGERDFVATPRECRAVVGCTPCSPRAAAATVSFFPAASAAVAGGAVNVAPLCLRRDVCVVALLMEALLQRSSPLAGVEVEAAAAKAAGAVRAAASTNPEATAAELAKAAARSLGLDASWLGRRGAMWIAAPRHGRFFAPWRAQKESSGGQVRGARLWARVGVVAARKLFLSLCYSFVRTATATAVAKCALALAVAAAPGTGLLASLVLAFGPNVVGVVLFQAALELASLLLRAFAVPLDAKRYGRLADFHAAALAALRELQETLARDGKYVHSPLTLLVESWRWAKLPGQILAAVAPGLPRPREGTSTADGFTESASRCLRRLLECSSLAAGTAALAELFGVLLLSLFTSAGDAALKILLGAGSLASMLVSAIPFVALPFMLVSSTYSAVRALAQDSLQEVAAPKEEAAHAAHAAHAALAQHASRLDGAEAVELAQTALEAGLSALPHGDGDEARVVEAYRLNGRLLGLFAERLATKELLQEEGGSAALPAAVALRAQRSAIEALRRRASVASQRSSAAARRLHASLRRRQRAYARSLEEEVLPAAIADVVERLQRQQSEPRLGELPWGRVEAAARAVKIEASESPPISAPAEAAGALVPRSPGAAFSEPSRGRVGAAGEADVAPASAADSSVEASRRAYGRGAAAELAADRGHR